MYSYVQSLCRIGLCCGRVVVGVSTVVYQCKHNSLYNFSYVRLDLELKAQMLALLRDVIFFDGNL